MRELLLKWEGTEYRCRVTHDLIMQIENKVVLQELAQRLTNGAESLNFPMSHISWLFYCVLRSAGAPVTTEGVWTTVRDNSTDPETLNTLIGFIYAEVYGVGPAEELPEGAAGKKE